MLQPRSTRSKRKQNFRPSTQDMCCNHMIENADERLALQTSSSGASGVVFFDFFAGSIGRL